MTDKDRNTDESGERNAEIPPKPERIRSAPNATMLSDQYDGRKLIADLCGNFVTLIVGLAWPGTVLLLVYYLILHASNLSGAINKFMQNKQSVEVSAGPTEGVIIRIIAREVQSGLSQQVTTEPGPAQPSIEDLRQVASAAAVKLVPQGLQQPETLVKVLWVDDHPQNNIGLQYAFQSLGIVVICIDSNDEISEAFRTSGGFDVVITDMYRDATRNRPAEPTAGLQTVSNVHSQHPRVPVIIYAGRYSAEHANEAVSPPVIADTNNTQRVFEIVADIAVSKRRNR